MLLSIVSPIIYLCAGLILGKFPIEIKGYIAMILTRIIIPLVIIYNIAMHKEGTFVIIFGIMTIMGSMLILSRLFTKDPIQSLCFFYLNIGWLGLPIASALFGNDAATIIIAAYVGSSLFGNSISVSLMAQGQSLKTNIKHTLRSPPIWALLIGIACIPFHTYIESIHSAYQIAKFLMGFMGMLVLGIWLSSTSITLADFKKAFFTFLLRGLIILIMASTFIVICQHYKIDLIVNNQPALYLLCFLPPSANIVILETHYMKNGRSANLIACGTCISIIAIAIYIFALFYLTQITLLFR